MLGKLFDKILHEEEDISPSVEGEDKKAKEPAALTQKNRKDLFVAFAIFVFALGLRLYFLYFVSDPQNPGDGWADDSFHHWLIAYLTREVGLSKGFLRLWDFKGMEYFWGPLHPLLMILMFKISGSVSIINARILSAIFGSLVIAVLYLIIAKFWNRATAFATSFLAVVHPVGILDDTFGLIEPIAFFLLFLGMLIIGSSPFIAGVLWGIAAMARAEAWLFGGLLLLLSIRVLKKPGQIPALFLGWGITVLVYMKYLLDHTGNLIYPVWWNYLANARGVWAQDAVFKPYQLAVRPYLIAWFVVSLVALGLVWWKAKGRRFLFLSFGFATWAFIGGFMGLTHYLKGFEPWFWYIRFFQYSYYFLGFLIALALFYVLPKKVQFMRRLILVLWIPVLVLAGIYQLIFWKPIIARYDETRRIWTRTKMWAQRTANAHGEGRILVPENYPGFHYALVSIHKVEGKDMLGQMFDPFYYIQGDPYQNWGENRKEVLGWIKDEDIRLIVVDSNRDRYMRLFEKEKQIFEYIEKIPDSPFVIYRIYPEKIQLD